MKKSILFIISLVVLLSSVLTVVAFAKTSDFEDDMFDDDVNVTYDAGTTATTNGGFLGNIGGDGIGDFVGGVVESVFSDEDVSEQVNDKAGGVFDSIGGIFDGFKDFGSLIPTTQKSTVGSNFFDTIDPVVTGSFNSNLGQNVTASSPLPSLNGESVDFNTGVNPYTKPVAQLNPGDKSDGVKWLQWILIYTECGLQNVITGEYDDATAAAVKNLQLKYGMNVDGIASLEVIEKAEQMCNEYKNGITPGGTSSPAVFNTVGNAGNTTQGSKNSKPADDIVVTAIIVCVIILWIFAIAAVFIIVHIKKKKLTVSDDGEIIKPEKVKKEKTNKKKKNSQRPTGTFSDYKPLRESQTLQSLENDSQNNVQYNQNAFQNEENVGFEIIDIDDDFDEGELTISSLSEIKQRRAAMSNEVKTTEE